jgi:hypothetical protein
LRWFPAVGTARNREPLDDGQGSELSSARPGAQRGITAAVVELAQVLDESEGIGPERCSAGIERGRALEDAAAVALLGGRFPVPGLGDAVELARGSAGIERCSVACPWRCSPMTAAVPLALLGGDRAAGGARGPRSRR